MLDPRPTCVLLADRHHGVAEGISNLLRTLFETVVMVSDARSLQESAGRLEPDVAVIDLSLTREASLDWLRRLHDRCPDVKLVILSDGDEESVRRAVTAAGADRMVCRRSIATDLLPAIESLSPDAPPTEVSR